MFVRISWLKKGQLSFGEGRYPFSVHKLCIPADMVHMQMRHLNVNFTDLFGEEKRSIVVRKNERKPLVHSEGSRITWYALSQGSSNRMGPIWGVLEEGDSIYYDAKIPHRRLFN